MCEPILTVIHSLLRSQMNRGGSRNKSDRIVLNALQQFSLSSFTNKFVKEKRNTKKET